MFLLLRLVRFVQVLFPGFEPLDVYGPLELIQSVSLFNELPFRHQP